VLGDVVAAPEVTMSSVIQNLSKIIQVCGSRPVYVLTPVPRYTYVPCCTADGHCTHIGKAEYVVKLCCDIFRMSKFILAQLKELPNVTVVCTADILVGRANAAPSEILSAMSTWGSVHGPQSAYTAIALKLLNLFASSSGPNMKRQRESGDGDGLQRSRARSFGEGVSTLISYPVRRQQPAGATSYPPSRNGGETDGSARF
jgi:hypothetical protein